MSHDASKPTSMLASIALIVSLMGGTARAETAITGQVILERYR